MAAEDPCPHCHHCRQCDYCACCGKCRACGQTAPTNDLMDRLKKLGQEINKPQQPRKWYDPSPWAIPMAGAIEGQKIGRLI